MVLENDLGRDDIKKLVFRLAIPSMLAQFINVLYGVIDRIYVGNIAEIGDLALAGIGICAPITALVLAFASWIGVGGAPLLSIYLGEDKKDEARRVLASSFMMLCVISCVLSILLLLFKKPLLLEFGASEVIYPLADEYFSVYILGTIFALLALGMNQFILSQGFAKVAMKSVLIGAILNIVLDPIFIFTLDMKIQGAALATVISQVVSCAYTLRFLFGKQTLIPITFGGYSCSIMKKILKIGVIPFIIVALDSVMLIALNMVFKSYGGEKMGDLLITATAILQSFMLMITMPLSGITMGTQAILGYNYGARNSKRVLSAQKYIFILSLIFILIMLLIAQTIPHLFVRIFTDNVETIQLTSWAIKIYTLALIGVAIQYVVVDGFTGMGVINVAILLSMGRKSFFFIFVCLIPLVSDVTHVYYAAPLSDTIGATITSICYCLLIKRILRKRELAV